MMWGIFSFSTRSKMNHPGGSGCVYVRFICMISLVYNLYTMCGADILQPLIKLTSSFSQHVHSLWLQLHHFDMKKRESDAWMSHQRERCGWTAGVKSPDGFFFFFLENKFWCFAGPLIFIMMKKTLKVTFVHSISYVYPLHCRWGLFFQCLGKGIA